MKKFIYITCIAILTSSCNKWLDINDNPNSANSTVPTPEQRLPPLLAQFADAYESAGTRAAFLSQQLAVTYAVNNNWNLTRWYSTAASIAWPWQAWYVNAAVNVTPLIEASEKVGAHHYIGAAKIIKAWGFGTLADLYGMMPYDEFDDATTFTPRFDDGAYIQEKVIELLDEAIVDLGKTQDAAAPSLAEGDIFNGGSVDNWIRLAHGLKARFLNHLSKKADYNPQAVLDALSKGPQADGQSTIIQYVDETATTANVAKASLQYQNNSASRITKLYYDYILNNYTGAPGGGNNMEDPRADLLIPSIRNSEGVYVRSIGVDMQSDLPNSGPLASDTRYVQLRPNPISPQPGQEMLHTGTWYTFKDSKGLLFTNAEARFIEAEVQFRLNQPSLALAAYKAGIRSHMNLMGVPSSEIDAFLASTSVVQNPAALTMSHIMIQKYIALSYSPELFTDVRRLDFCTDASGNYNETAGVYKGFNRPSHVLAEAYPSMTDWPRRLAVASYEINFNLEQVLRANPNADKLTYLNEPVWWDRP